MNEDLILVSDFCSCHNIEITFVQELSDNGLIQLRFSEDSMFISADEILYLEKMVRLRHEMDINIHGIETIMHLLKQIERMQKDIHLLEEKLRLHEV